MERLPAEYFYHQRRAQACFGLARPRQQPEQGAGRDCTQRANRLQQHSGSRRTGLFQRGCRGRAGIARHCHSATDRGEDGRAADGGWLSVPRLPNMATGGDRAARPPWAPEDGRAGAPCSRAHHFSRLIRTNGNIRTARRVKLSLCASRVRFLDPVRRRMLLDS
jgi:hypothetical protein